MRLNHYPIALKLKGKNVLVAGGGKVAERKTKMLLGSGARVTIVSPKITAVLDRSARLGLIRWVKRGIREQDTRRAYLVIAATSDHALNGRISKLARRTRALVNVVDKPSISDFISPALFRKHGAIITVYTDGRDPVLSRDLKNFLKEHWDAFLSYRRRS